MAIHDLDMARFLMGSEPVGMFAMGSVHCVRAGTAGALPDTPADADCSRSWHCLRHCLLACYMDTDMATWTWKPVDCSRFA